MFIHNKYYTWYFSIINRSKSRKLVESVYIEKHHIIPKSLDGTNDPANIVSLTAKEHFICHMLLIKFTSGKYKSKMINAAWAIANLKTKDQPRTKVNSRSYAILREQFAKQYALWRTGQKHSPETKAKMSIAHKGKPSKLKGVPRTAKTKAKISNSLKGKPKSDAYKKWLSKMRSGVNHPNYGKTLSEDIRLKISNARKQTKKLKCIYCNREIDPGNFKQFHGDMCKFNILSPRYKA